MKALYIATFALGICACAQSTKPAKATYSVTNKVGTHNHGRDLTTQWHNTERTSASIEEGRYTHVMANRKLSDFDGKVNDVEEVKPKPLKVTTDGSVSVYELSRWERYCKKGEGSDKRDWIFYESSKYEVPAVMADTCEAPGFKRSQYIAAWEHKCTGRTLSQLDSKITTLTLKPASCSKPRK